MSDRAEASRAWDTAIAALRPGKRPLPTGADAEPILANLRWATTCDPGMSDAWLARWALGDTSRDVVVGMYESVDRHGEEIARSKLTTAAFNARFDLDDTLSWGLRNADEVVALYGRQLISDGRGREAVELLGERADAPDPWKYLVATAYAVAQIWDRAIPAYAPVIRSSDVPLSEAAASRAGMAHAALANYAESIPFLDVGVKARIESVRLSATFFRALVARALGEEAACQRLLADALALAEKQGWSDRDIPTRARAALRDPSYVITVTTVEEIAARPDIWDPKNEKARIVLADAAEKAPVAPSTPTTPPPPIDKEQLLATTMAELDAQIGMDNVKAEVHELLAQVRVNRVREARGLPVAQRTAHLVFQGPPGTGKTTVARIIARLYYAVGLLTGEKVVETSRADFVGSHLGHSAVKAGATIDRALNGVLFIDEAYSLSDGAGIEGGDAFGREAVSVLLSRMENDRDRLVVIIAGYKDEMDRFLASNPGLESRFATRVTFESYTAAELALIAASVGRQIHAPLTPAAEALFVTRVSSLTPELLDRLGNARFARECVNSAAGERDLRIVRLDADALMALTDDELQQITESDLAAAIDERLGNL